MRLDKYLKVARILKRRTVSNSVAKQEKVLVNSKIAKPALQVKPGDLITIQFGNRVMSIKVLSIDMPKGKSDELMYEIVEVQYTKKDNE